jgi:hypothetical protein
MDKDKKLYKVVSFLDREELDFLDDVVKDIYFNHGIKIPRAKLIEEIIEALKDKKDGDALKALEEGFIKMFKEEKNIEKKNREVPNEK